MLGPDELIEVFVSAIILLIGVAVVVQLQYSKDITPIIDAIIELAIPLFIIVFVMVVLSEIFSDLIS